VAHVMPSFSDTVHRSYLSYRHRILESALRRGVDYRLIRKNRVMSNRNWHDWLTSLRRRWYNDNARNAAGWPRRFSNENKLNNMADNRIIDGVTVCEGRGVGGMRRLTAAAASTPLVMKVRVL